MYCHAYILEYTGFYLKGVIIVVEENLQRAKERIEKELIESGICVNDFNINDVAPIDLKKPKTVYLDNGDY